MVGATFMVGGGLLARGLPQSQDLSCATAYNRLVWSTDLALNNSERSHTPHHLSLTKADHPAKVSGRYLQRPGSLRCTKKDLSFLCIRI